MLSISTWPYFHPSLCSESVPFSICCHKYNPKKKHIFNCRVILSVIQYIDIIIFTCKSLNHHYFSLKKFRQIFWLNILLQTFSYNKNILLSTYQLQLFPRSLQCDVDLHRKSLSCYNGVILRYLKER